MRSFIALSCVVASAAFVACSGSATVDSSSSGEALTLDDNHEFQRRPVRQVPKSDNPYTLFESLQVRPLALSPDGQLLFATNTPDNRLEIFRVNRRGLEPLGSVEVGLEPVAVAARSDDEVWVVNHLSDSVSIVDVGNG